MSEGPTPFVRTRFVTAPHARADHPDFRVVWPFGGLPAVLDQAAGALLDCYGSPATPLELTADVSEALEIDYDTAYQSVVSAAQTFRKSGLVIAEGEQPMPGRYLNYPAGASP